MVVMDVFFETTLAKGVSTVDEDPWLVGPYGVFGMAHTADV